jgi:L-alanine-DL-glutamate epimerase-like enolase superfamily enzyme
MRLELTQSERQFREAQHTAHGMLQARQLIEVTLTDADGASGRGEAAPLASYDGVGTDTVIAALEAYRQVLAQDPPSQPGTLLDRCREVADLPQALAAIDLALWDLAGNRAGRPVCDLLAAHPAQQIEVNATIAPATREAAADLAAGAVSAGYRCVKLKVGVGDDLERVRAVRAAIGPDVSLRLDANGAWSVAHAVELLDAMSAVGLELVEEPVRGLGDLQDLRERVAVRIAIDESAALPGALTARIADAVCLKISRCGGISGLLAAAALVRASGAEVYLASSYDGPLGIAAALHAAAALSPLPPCGLATLELFAGPPSPFPVRQGTIAVPRGPGLGVAADSPPAA